MDNVLYMKYFLSLCKFMRYRYQLFTYSRWDEKIVKIFKDEVYFSDNFNFKYKGCFPIEIVYSHNQLINFFAVVAVRIYFNIGKKYFFVRQFRQKHLYNYFLQQSRKLFSAVIKNVRKRYVSEAVSYLTLVRDYDPAYLKITNTFYMHYIGNKYKDAHERWLDLEKRKKNVHENVLDCA